jgi:hypothetical protein
MSKIKMGIVNKCKIKPLFHSKHEKKTKKYECLTCLYVTNRKSNYLKHMLTKRHLQKNKLKYEILSVSLFLCVCGKSYKYKSGYYRHKCDKKQKIIDIAKNERKLRSMVNIRKQCTFNGCKTNPYFNFENETKAIFCYQHKIKTMENIISKRCSFKGCNLRPYYNYENEQKVLYCKNHKLQDMVYIKSKQSKKCEFSDCKSNPYFNFENETKAIFCSQHKEKNMVNIKDKKCRFPDCKTIPTFNFENEKAIFCLNHKSENMINVKSKRCEFSDCKKQPTFNYENEKKALFCFDHKFENMINVKYPICKTPMCYTQVSKKYEGYCLYCFMHLFPDKPVSRNYKTKENHVVQFIKSTFIEQNWTVDKQILNGCSKRRPDLLLDLGYQIIIVEIDENQHIDYDCSCENKRMMELSQDVGHRPIIFIRFNPDDYFIHDKKITSCWTYNKRGICVVKKTKINEWNERLLMLKNQIEYWMNPDNQTEKMVEIIHLFYDVI